MAGDIKRQRKSWTLQDRSKVSINILRANLAEEGDEDAQLDMAKRLLQESSDTEAPERSRKENARLALYWLIKSSEQGNDEATQLLKECLQSGSGLTAQNILDVQTCITTPKYEKLTFKAARLLYRKLSNGEEFITTAQLLARLNAKGRSTVAFGNIPSDPIAPPVEIVPEENGTDFLEEQQKNSSMKKDENSTPCDSPQANDSSMKEFINLNETFTVFSANNSGLRSSAASRKSASPNENSNRSFIQHQPQIPLDELPQLDLQFAMMQSGKKLTLSDLLSISKDFNVGKAPKIALDKRNKMRSRYQWNVDSILNIFITQLLILGVVGNVIRATNALAYFLFLGIMWSSYNCFLWKLRRKNFEDWKLAFESVLVDKWETNKLITRLSVRYQIPHLAILSLGPLLLPKLIENQHAILHVSMGVIVIFSIQFGLQHRWLLTFQQILVLCLTVLYYHSSIVSNVFGQNVIEQTNLLHQPMFQVGDSYYLSYLPVSLDMFTLLVFAILSTTVKLSTHKIINETISNAVLTLWIIKTVQTSVSVESSHIMLGICLGLVVCVVMVLLCSHMETWKILLIFLSCLLVCVVFGIIVIRSRPEFLVSQEELHSDKVHFLEWETYEASCHRKAWNVQSPAATQIKCSSMYSGSTGTNLVKWKGRISLVKVENLSRSIQDPQNIEDVVFDISVGIFSLHKADGSRNWQNFLSGSSETDIVAPASLIVSTNNVYDRKKKQDLIDHILNLRTGDRIEFIGKLKGSTAGSLKPQIINVQSIQCISCTTADYGEFVIEKSNLSMSILEWLEQVIMEIRVQAKNSHFVENYKNYLTNLFSQLYSTIL